MENVFVSDNNIQIKDSYLIKSRKEMKKILKQIEEEYPEHPTFTYPTYVLVAEWCTHNLLYSLGLYRNRTKDTDLDANKATKDIIAYLLVSLLYWH